MPATPMHTCRIWNKTGLHIFFSIRGVARSNGNQLITDVEETYSFPPDPLGTGSIVRSLYEGRRVVMAWDDVTFDLVTMYDVPIFGNGHVYIVPYVARYSAADTTHAGPTMATGQAVYVADANP